VCQLQPVYFETSQTAFADAFDGKTKACGPYELAVRVLTMSRES